MRSIFKFVGMKEIPQGAFIGGAGKCSVEEKSLVLAIRTTGRFSR
jgi:hypothetical protein